MRILDHISATTHLSALGRAWSMAVAQESYEWQLEILVCLDKVHFKVNGRSLSGLLPIPAIDLPPRLCSETGLVPPIPRGPRLWCQAKAVLGM